MSSCKTPKVLKKIEINADDKIGEQLIAKDLCFPSEFKDDILSQNYYLNDFLPNDEYKWSFFDDKECHYCEQNLPQEVLCETTFVTWLFSWILGFATFIYTSGEGKTKNCTPKKGKKAVYERVKYSGEPIKCCLSENKIIDGKTCDPKYTNENSEECYGVRRNYCSDYDKFFNDPICKQWCATNQVDCQLLGEEICNNQNKFGKECINWCHMNPGKCDTTMQKLCETSPDLTQCSCINSKLNKHNYNPICSDRRCINFGYVTESQLISRGQGCEVVDCDVYFNLSDTGEVIFDDVNLDSRCGNVSPEQIHYKHPHYKYFIIIIVIVIALLIIIIAFSFW